MNQTMIQHIARKHNGPFYLYDESVIAAQTDALLTNFPEFEFLYSVKTNPMTLIVKYVVGRGFGADAASPAEVDIALKAGAKPEDIYYSTPGKTKSDLERSIGKCLIIADSLNELTLLNRIAEEKKIDLAVGLRLNPNFSMGGGPGATNRFGVDEEIVTAGADFFRNLTRLKITGLHIHLRSQVLDDSALAAYYESIFQVALKCQEALGWQLEFINFGGGLGIPYSTAHDSPLNLPRLGAECQKMLAKYQEILKVRRLIETGRFIIGQAGTYVTPVVDIKESRGVKYLVVKGVLNGFCRPAIAELLAAAGAAGPGGRSLEPLFTAADAFDFNIIGPQEDAPQEKVTIVGNLCAATDTLVSNIMLPKAEIGNLVTVSKAGSYSYSLSALVFSSHHRPMQVYMDSQGTLTSV